MLTVNWTTGVALETEAAEVEGVHLGDDADTCGLTFEADDDTWGFVAFKSDAGVKGVTRETEEAVERATAETGLDAGLG